MIISNLDIKENLDVDYAKYDDAEYIISFKEKHSRLPWAHSPHQSGVIVSFNYGPHPDILPYVQEPVTYNVMNAVLVITLYLSKLKIQT